MAITKWTVDPMHSEVQFKVRHLMITNVTGSFQHFEGEIETEEDDFTKGKVVFTIKTNSVDTANDQRDEHLRSADFFNSSEFPEIKFEGGSLESAGSDAYDLKGNLTIKGNTKPVTLKVEYGGIADDFYGNTKAGFSVSGKISRKEFGLTWDAVTETGSIVVSDDVKLSAEVQFVKNK